MRHTLIFSYLKYVQTREGQRTDRAAGNTPGDPSYEEHIKYLHKILQTRICFLFWEVWSLLQIVQTFRKQTGRFRRY